MKKIKPFGQILHEAAVRFKPKPIYATTWRKSHVIHRLRCSFAAIAVIKAYLKLHKK